MFGFIKMFQRFIKKLKSNKRLWFTTVFLISSIGIVVLTSLLIFTTNNVSNKVYANQAIEYELRLKSLESSIETKLNQINIALKQNLNIINAVSENNQVRLEELENQFNSQIKEEEKNTLLIKLYSVKNKDEILRNSIISSIQTKNNIFGVEVIYNGVFYIFLSPVIQDDEVIGVIEVRQSIYALKDSFNALKQEHIFLLDSKMAPLLSIQYKEGKYMPVGKNYQLNTGIYDTQTLGYIPDIDFKAIQKIIDGEYILTKDLYLNGVVVRDTNGVDIGLILLGENITKNGGFINMSQNMTNQVIMIALGLIVSLLLFLF